MAKINFTTDRIADHACDPGKTASFLWDASCPSLGLRTAAPSAKKPGGAKSFIFQAKLNREVIRITIGRITDWSIPDARTEARRLMALVDSGQDPRQVKADALAAKHAEREAKAAEAAAAEEAERRASVVLADAWPLYIEYGKTKRNKRTGDIGWSAAHLLAHIELSAPGGEQMKKGAGITKARPLAALMPLCLTELTSDRIAAWLNEETKTRPTAAALSFRLLRAFAGWAADHPRYSGLIPADAFTARKVRDTVPKSETKDGDSLQREQLVLWFEHVRRIGNPVISAYLQGLLLTGARRRELSALQWSDVDFKWRSMTLRDKTEGTRTIPMPPYLAHLLQSLPRRNEWVFSSPAAKDGKITEPRFAHTDALKAAGLPHISLHGLRRSFGTLCEWVECPAGVVAQIMGHSASALAEKHYRRRPLDLLRMWHDKIEAWVLEQAGISFDPEQAKPGLRAVPAA